MSDESERPVRIPPRWAPALTKSERRERIATALLAGLMANPKFETHCGHGEACVQPSIVALEHADYLIALLKKRPKPVVVDELEAKGEV